MLDVNGTSEANKNCNANGTSEADKNNFSKALQGCMVCNQVFDVTKKKLLRCSKCRMPYCSKECQRKDWVEGDHKKMCKMRRKLDRSSLGFIPKASLKNDANFSQMAASVFNDRLPVLLLMVQYLDLDPHECVYVIDFYSSAIPTGEPVSFETFLPPHPHRVFLCAGSSPEEMDHTKHIVRRNCSNQALTLFAVDPEGGCLLKTCKIPIRMLMDISEQNQIMAKKLANEEPESIASLMDEFKKFGMKR